MIIVLSFVCLGKSSSKASKEQESTVSGVTSQVSANSSSTLERKKQSARPVVNFDEVEKVVDETNARSPDANIANAKVPEESGGKDVCKINFVLN